MKFGLIGAVVVVAVMTAAYMFSKNLYLSPALNWGIVLLYVPFMWMSLQHTVKTGSAGTDFRAMLRSPFLTFIIINLGFYLLMYGLFLSDQELLSITTQKEIAFFESELANGTGDPQRSNELREKLQYLRDHGMRMPLGPVLLQMCIGAIGGFGISAMLVFLLQSRQK